jgi:hypothetical protein
LADLFRALRACGVRVASLTGERAHELVAAEDSAQITKRPTVDSETRCFEMCESARLSVGDVSVTTMRWRPITVEELANATKRVR